MFVSSFRIFFFLILVLAACSKRKSSGISGHWVSIEYFKDRPYHTLDIFDSILYVNMKCKVCGHVEMKLRQIRSNQFAATIARRDVPNFFGYSDDYFLAQRNDSIVFVWTELGLDSLKFDEFNQLLHDAQSQNYNSLFVRSDEIISSSSDPYAPFYVTVDPASLGAEDIVEINERLVSVADMFVGKPKSEQWQIPDDSVVMETDDVFINLKDVPLWVSRHQDLVTPLEREKIVIRLSLDKTVTDAFRRRLIQVIRIQAPSARILEARLDTKKGEVFFVNTK